MVVIIIGMKKAASEKKHKLKYKLKRKLKYNLKFSQIFKTTAIGDSLQLQRKDLKPLTLCPKVVNKIQKNTSKHWNFRPYSTRWQRFLAFYLKLIAFY